jgi:hypothetical protein
MSPILKADDFLFNSFQVVVFWSLPQIAIGRVFGQLMAALGDRFDGAPMMLPIPQNAPAEIPRLTLQSSDSQWGADFALSRMTFRWVQMKREDTQLPSSFKDSFIDFFNKVLKIQKPEITRLAFLINRYMFTDDTASIISEAILNEDL